MFIVDHDTKQKFPVIRNENGLWECKDIEEEPFRDIIDLILICNIADNLHLEIEPEERRNIYAGIETEIRSYQEAISVALCFTLTDATGVNYADY